MIPAHSYGKAPKKAVLDEKGYAVWRFGGKDYIVKLKYWDLHGKQYATADVLGEARFGNAMKVGERAAGKKLEIEVRLTRSLADAVKRASNMPVEEPAGRLFYRPMPRSIAGNAVKEQMLEAMFFNCFRNDMKSDAHYLAWDGPIQEKYLNFLAYKLKLEEIFKS